MSSQTVSGWAFKPRSIWVQNDFLIWTRNTHARSPVSQDVLPFLWNSMVILSIHVTNQWLISQVSGLPSKSGNYTCQDLLGALTPDLFFLHALSPFSSATTSGDSCEQRRWVGTPRSTRYQPTNASLAYSNLVCGLVSLLRPAMSHSFPQFG